MDDVRLFTLAGARPHSVAHRRYASEADLRRYVVRYAEPLLGVTVLVSEFSISTDGGGRIDAIGVDARHCPVITEFKLTASGTAICQGLFYLDWLLTHRDVFTRLVLERLGTSQAMKIDWTAPRLLCIAETIGEREEAVARQIGRPVELLQVRRLPGGSVLIQRPAVQA